MPTAPFRNTPPAYTSYAATSAPRVNLPADSDVAGNVMWLFMSLEDDAGSYGAWHTELESLGWEGRFGVHGSAHFQSYSYSVGESPPQWAIDGYMDMPSSGLAVWAEGRPKISPSNL